MIEYIEVRDYNTTVIGIVDTATSVIWHSVYFGVGDFELHVPVTPDIISLLTAGRYVTRPNNEEVGIIEKLYISVNAEEGMTITASGRFVKSILDRRLIYNLSGNSNYATILSGNVESAVREVVKDNAIACPFDSNRNIALLALGAPANIPLQIVDENGDAAEKQVSYENLLTYTDGVLEEYGLAAKCVLRNGMFLYTVYRGIDRSTTNINTMPVVFSNEFDNLISSEYTYDETPEKNVALIGGEGEGVDRFYSLITKNERDLQRREVFIDASSTSRKYKDKKGVEKTYTDTQYKKVLNAKGKQDIATLTISQIFDGVLDVTYGTYKYGRDFFLGDIVTMQNNNIGVYSNVRIREVLEYQNQNGYAIEIKYQ